MRRRAGAERGFTLIELLVVLLILGILAAVGMTVLLNQRGKANDTNAKASARAMQIAAETCANDFRGSYDNCDETALRAIDPTIPTSGILVTNLGTDTYTVSADSTTGNVFSVEKNGGMINRPCTVDDAQRGGCPGSGTDPGTW